LTRVEGRTLDQSVYKFLANAVIVVVVVVVVAVVAVVVVAAVAVAVVHAVVRNGILLAN